MQKIMTSLREIILGNKKKFLIVISVLLLTTLVLYNVNTNKLKGELPSSAKEKGFTDEFFYACVISAYNDAKGTALDRYSDLPEDLNEITTLDCSSDRNIKNINGIENLSNLKNLNLSDNALTGLNLRNNTLLESLDISNNNLVYLDLYYNSKLSIINLYNAFSSDKIADVNITKDEQKEITILQSIYLPSGNDINYSYDNNIISINDGIVTGLNEGTTTITAENNKFGYLFSINVNVTSRTEEPLNVTLKDNRWSIIDNYIFTQNETDKESILNDIRTNKGTASFISDDEIAITYNDEIIKTYKVANFSSDTYIFDKVDQGYIIYVFNENIDQNHLKLTNCEIEQDGLDVYVKINGKKIETLNSAFFYSPKHDLLNDYILFENDDNNDIKVKAKISGEIISFDTKDLTDDMINETDNEISMFCNLDEGTCFKNLKKLRINFGNYEVKDGIINTTKENDDFNTVTTTDCEKEIKDGKLLVKYNGNVIKTYVINVVDKNIVTTTKKEEDKTEDKKATTKEVSKNGTTNTTNKKIDDFIPKTESDTTTTKTTTRIEDKYNAIDAKLRSLSKRNSNRNIIILLLSLTAVILSLIIVNMLLKIKKSKKK